MIDAQKAGLSGLDSRGCGERRRQSGADAPYKKKILAEVEAAAGSGGIGEILRREGIYSSTLTSWRKERDTAVDGTVSRKRGLEPKRNPLASENEKFAAS